ncbi:MAG TPA: preprotein translocase subunit SecY [Bacteroidia bacterium]|nr:MAG: protein translocase subunit secY/sec61 alpha [Bacteroidetes bacterium OLB10]MBE7509299.1 preprotein translocase subunit SecY [Bacteroidia bacterium]MBX3106376.1 preprotein translocase subunit SecY [Bacteroidota bacterium]MCE7954210.1 preprotein translocase subunit SecY [Bacteroidetes bacterium CHB6]OQB64368.1 MAG: preprotein translocase subunit SecY [Bacteroidetes bacterium ADurb.Bin141]
MKDLIQTLRNIFKIEELRTKLLNTFLFIAVYRLASHIVLPGVDPNLLGSLKNQASQGIFGLLDMFAGGAFSQASIVALGIMPYISASIVVQILGVAVPYFQKMQKEGESGRNKINQITRWLTVLVVAGQAPGYLVNLRAQAQSAIIAYSNPDALSPTLWWITSIIILISGTLFVMWLGERIQEKGIGNGISLLIMVGIIARLPFALRDEFMSRLNQTGGGLIMFLVELVALFAVVVVSILLVQGTRKIPVQFAKKIVGNRQYGGVRQYIPLKVNAAGVMPIIFAQAIMFIPATIAQFFPESSSMQGIAHSMTDFHSVGYNVSFALLIILFTYFYTAITVNPNQMADDMKKNGGFIPGIKPGKQTASFIDDVMSKITLPGSIFLAIVAILPAMTKVLGVSNNFAQFYGGTSLLILVGVILDTLQQIESHLLMRHYDGLMKSGRIKGRTSISAPV